MEMWQKIKRQYEEKGAVTIQGQRIGDNGRFKDMLSYVPFPESFEGQRVIDIGCCGGWWSYLAEERGAAEVIAVDIDPTMLKIAEANRPEGSKVKFIRLDAANLRLGRPPFDRPFDTALLMAVLHYTEKPDWVIKRVASILKSDGRCLVETYTKESTEPGPSIYKYQPTPQQLRELLATQFTELSASTFRLGGTPVYTRTALWAKKHGGVFVFLTGASGTGKTSLLTELGKRHPDWHIIRPDIEMGLQTDESGVLKDKRWGRDFASFFAEMVPQAVQAGAKTILVEAVMPSSGARHKLLEFIPDDWRRICVVFDYLPDEFETFFPYNRDPDGAWRKKLQVFDTNSPCGRTKFEPYDMILRAGPDDTPRLTKMIECSVDTV